MKTVIIGGVCRTGKSRLANKIFQSTKSTVFHADTLTNILKNNYPEVFKVDWELNGSPIKEPSEKVLVKLIRNMGKEFNYIRIFDTSALDPLTAYKTFDSKNFIVLYMAYPIVEPYEKLEEIRNYARENSHCWSHKFNDNTMLKHIEHFKLVSRYIEMKCQETGITFYDTSTDFLRVFNQAYSDVMNQLAN